MTATGVNQAEVTISTETKSDIDVDDLIYDDDSVKLVSER